MADAREAAILEHECEAARLRHALAQEAFRAALAAWLRQVNASDVGVHPESFRFNELQEARIGAEKTLWARDEAERALSARRVDMPSR